MIPPLRVDMIEGIRVVRDDLVLGGTKARVVPLLFSDRYEEYVYASPVQGYAQVALAYAAKEHGKRATIFCAKRNQMFHLTWQAKVAGAMIEEVGPTGYLSVVRARARDYCNRTGAFLVPFGLDVPIVRDGLAALAMTIEEPHEVWTVAGSGMLSRALQQAWPNAVFNAVVIGARLETVGRAKLWYAPEKYEQNARIEPPFPSCSNYDAKAWRFIKQHATPGALMWNVAR